MLFNWLIGFVIPWIFGIYLLRKDFIHIVRIGPAAGLIAFLFSDIGYYMEWFQISPFRSGSLSFVPYNLGIYIILPSYMVYLINRAKKLPAFLAICAFSIVKTILEAVLVYTGKVIYLHGWNLIWTFVSYVLACSATYMIYLFIASTERKNRN